MDWDLFCHYTWWTQNRSPKCWCLSSFAQSRKVPFSFVIFPCISPVPTVWIFLKFDVGDFSENATANSKSGWNHTKISGTLHEDLGTFYCFRLHKFSIKTFLCNAQSFFVLLTDVEFNYTYTTHCWVYFFNRGFANAPRCYIIGSLPTLLFPKLFPSNITADPHILAEVNCVRMIDILN